MMGRRVFFACLAIVFLLPCVKTEASGPRYVQHDDEVFVEVYVFDDDDDYTDNMYGYMQSCGDHADAEWPHVCAYTPRKSLKIGSYGDPSLGSLSLVLPEKNAIQPSEIFYASPCGHQGTIMWAHGDHNCIKGDDQAIWDLHEVEDPPRASDGSSPYAGLVYERFYFMRHRRWQRWLGTNPSGPGCSFGTGMWCLNTNWDDDDPSTIAIKLVNTKDFCDAVKVTGWWDYRFSLTAPVSKWLPFGTKKQHFESKTETWDKSVTAQVLRGFNYSGGSAEVTVGGTLAHSMWNFYSYMWTTSTYQTFQFTSTKEDVGKSVWQFRFNITDSCKHMETTLISECAITKNREQIPCCLPGYATDKPSYMTCVSEEALAPGGRERGCKVQGLTMV